MLSCATVHFAFACHGQMPGLMLCLHTSCAKTNGAARSQRPDHPFQGTGRQPTNRVSGSACPCGFLLGSTVVQ